MPNLPLPFPGFEHVVAVLILLGRIGDIGTTWLITPRLTLEMNPIVRRFGWRFAFITLLIAFTPYASVPLGVSFAVSFLMISARNSSLVWSARALGERLQRDRLMETVRSSRRSLALSSTFAATFFQILIGALAMVLGEGGTAWSFWIGVGVVWYGVAIGLHSSLFILKIYREVDAQRAAAGPVS